MFIFIENIPLYKKIVFPYKFHLKVNFRYVPTYIHISVCE